MARSVGAGFSELDPRIHYHPKYGPTQNFGDYLPELLCQAFLTHPRIDADVFRLIGSVIDPQRIRNNLRRTNGSVAGLIAFWGCGARNGDPVPADLLVHCRFFGVRGPATRDLLGLPAETPMGDPGLLAPLFHTPQRHAETAGRTICIPHFEDAKPAEELLRLSGAAVLVHPEVDASEAALREILDKIASADFVLTASLHGAIIACAYGRPFAFWDNGHVDIPFKWQDFAGSIGIPATFVGDLDEGRRAYGAFRTAIRIPPLSAILDVCPFGVRPSMMARALAHDRPDDAAVLTAAAAMLDDLPGHRPEQILRLQADTTINRARRTGFRHWSRRIVQHVLRGGVRRLRRESGA